MKENQGHTIPYDVGYLIKLGLSNIREFLKRGSDIAYITDLEDRKISGRFVDKITDVASRCGTEDLKMLFKCTALVLDDMTSKKLSSTKTKQ